MLENKIEEFNTHQINRYDYKWEHYKEVKAVKPLKNYTVLETFAGAGGLALGLEKSGLISLGAIELDKYACQTLKINRPNWNILEGDIRTIAENGVTKYFDNLEDLDILSGGYPCQTFSYAGKREGFSDIRGTLFYPYSQMLKELKPKVFIAENVKGLVNHDNGRTLETMIKVFESNGYKVYWNVLNSWNYDVAQKRERIVIIGIRTDLIAQETFSFSFPKPQEYKPVLRDVLHQVPDSMGINYSEKKKKVIELVPPGGSWVDLPTDIAKEYMGASWFSGGGKRGMARRLSWDEPSLTLTTSPSQKQTERAHPDETRPFTIREYARIQSFPDDWEFYGGTSSSYKQIGNAVPVNLAKYIGKSVIDYLNQF
ncbi:MULTISPECIES: DNA cytosine methyltransferase [Lactobacillales]|uniref:DNA cytosine methyltransferase n=1 Tax=Lactobacillales TaxID=186826 RepID=UPI001E4E9B40|nr:DNA cytosine methyltransferase [Lactococcus garvieae]